LDRGPDGDLFQVVSVHRGLGKYRRWSRCSKKRQKQGTKGTHEKKKSSTSSKKDRGLLRKQIQRLLNAVNKKYDPANDHWVYAMDADVDGRRALLTMHMARKIQRGGKVMVVEPQGYDFVSVLDRRHMMFQEDLGNDGPFETVGLFTQDTPLNLATSGSGNDWWLVANRHLLKYLTKVLRTMP